MTWTAATSRKRSSGADVVSTVADPLQPGPDPATVLLKGLPYLNLDMVTKTPRGDITWARGAGS